MSADRILAADGGADRLREAGIVPETTIGDLDSLTERHGLAEILHDTDQDTSDVDKLLNWTAAQGVREITLVCAEGDRLDHILGTMASAARSPLDIRLALRRGLAWIVRGEFQIPTEPGDLISLMPLQECRGVDLEGVSWPLEGATLSSTAGVSLSNRATGTTVTGRLATGVAALFLLTPRLEVPTWPG